MADTEQVEGVKFVWAQASASGRFKSDSENEDRLLVVEDLGKTHGGRANDALFVCVDGHGGAAAANYFVKHFPFQLVRSRSYEDDPPKALNSAVKKLDKKFLKWAKSRSPPDDSGACILLALLRGNTFHISWAGDCRAILHHPSKEIIQLTMDHAPDNPKEKARLDAANVPIKNGRVFGILAPSRSFGDLNQKVLSDQGVITDCEYTSYVHKKDPDLTGTGILLLATDGVWCAMKNSRAINLLRGSLEDTQGFKKQKEQKTKEDFATSVLCRRGSMLGGDDTSAIAIFLENES